MDHEKIKTYEQAVDTINKVGFMPLSKNPYAYVSLEGITNFSNWHTGSIYDPWTWKDKIAFKKGCIYKNCFRLNLYLLPGNCFRYFLLVSGRNKFLKNFMKWVN